MPPQRSKILVVEDSFLLAEVLRDFVVDCGYECVGPAYTLELGGELARTAVFDAAVLDVDLHGRLSFPIGAELITRGIPFVFSTGFSKSLSIPAELRRAPIFYKPYPVEELQAVLQRLLRDSALVAQMRQSSWAR